MTGKIGEPKLSKPPKPFKPFQLRVVLNALSVYGKIMRL